MTDNTDGHDDKTILINQNHNISDEATVLYNKNNSQPEDPEKDSTTNEPDENIEIITSDTTSSTIAYDETKLETASETLKSIENPNLEKTHQSGLQSQTTVLDELGLTQSETTNDPDTERVDNPQNFLKESQEGSNESMNNNENEKTRILHPGMTAQSSTSQIQDTETNIAMTEQEMPVVGWLVIIEGPGKGNFRPLFYGNNTIGRNSDQPVPLDFGDTSISSEEQAYIQYNYKKREFLFIPNLSKTNIVELNEENIVTPTLLNSHDVIRMGETTLLFMPLCGPEFEWGDLSS